jgi:hypothetical protein
MKFIPLKSLAFFCLSALVLLSACQTKKKSNDSDLSIQKPADAKVSDADTAKLWVSTSGGKIAITLQDVSYLPFDYPFLHESNSGVIKVLRKQIRGIDAKGMQSTCSLSPVYQSKGKMSPWQTVVKAESVTNHDGVLLAKRTGTDDREDTYYLINPLNGQIVMIYSVQAIDALIPNIKERRYFGYLSRATEDHLLDESEKRVGRISYTSNRQWISGLDIKVNDEAMLKQISTYTPDMTYTTSMDVFRLMEEGKRLALMNLDEHYQAKDMSNFQAVLTYYVGDEGSPENIVIPVMNDKIDMEHITYNKNIFTITPLKSSPW